MKFIFGFLVLFASCSLFAGVDFEKFQKALTAAQMGVTKDTFFYVKEENPAVKEQALAFNRSVEKKTYPPYTLVLRGIPEGTQFELYNCNLLSLHNPSLVGSGYIDQYGNPWIRLQEGPKKLSSSYICPFDVMPGEPIFAVVVLRDKQTYIAASLVPEPLEAYGVNGRSVNMQMIDSSLPVYLTQGKNFKPNEEITWSLKTSDRTTTQKFQADANGSFVMLIEGSSSPSKRVESERVQFSTPEQLQPITLTYTWDFLQASGR